MTFAQQLRTLLSSHNTLVAPGVFDGLSALLTKQAGFQVAYASGGAISRSAGYPDLGLLTMTEVSNVINEIVQACQLPVIADADTGYGGTLNVRRTIHAFEQIGVAALHIEDQYFPKRCGHLEDKTLISCDDMCHKIKTACHSRSNHDMMIIARTDAIGVEGFDAAIKRAKAYALAGADMIFIEAPETVQQIELIAKEITTPKLINMFVGGKTPLVPLTTLEQLGYNVVIIPSDLQRAAIFSMQKTLLEIKTVGNSSALIHDMVSFKEREHILNTADYLKIDENSTH